MNKIMLLATLAALATTGCATKEYVHDYVQNQLETLQSDVKSLDQRVDRNDEAIRNVLADLSATQASVDEHAQRIARNETSISELSATAREALERAIAAQELSEGKMLYEVVLEDDTLKFGSDSAILSKSAKAALDDFAATLKADNQKVYIEIQGHTDSRGEAGMNLRLGQTRAEAVRHYLNTEAGIPLHRMSVISYGESRPIASNVNRQGRAQNRRVVLVVLR